MSGKFKFFSAITPCVFFAIYSFWWVFLNITDIFPEYHKDLFSVTYGIMAFFGFVLGISIALKWGGIRSVMGRAIVAFSVGLAFQEFGQLAYTYNIYYLDVDIYPSLGDVGYFGSIFFYIYAVLLLGKASGVKYSLKSVVSKIQAILIPIIVLVASYLYFLQGYVFDWSQPLTVFLDFGYPLGEAIYISLALLAFLLSRKVLGGVMKYRVLIILLALLLQYFADFTFLYQSSNGTWTVGGVNDFMYLIAYFSMTLGILQLRTDLIKQSVSEK